MCPRRARSCRPQRRFPLSTSHARSRSTDQCTRGSIPCSPTSPQPICAAPVVRTTVLSCSSSDTADEREVREGTLRCTVCGQRFPRPPRSRAPYARCTGARQPRGGRTRTVRRVHAKSWLGPGSDPGASEHRGWLLVRPGSLDASAPDDCAFSARRVVARCRIEHLLGDEPFRRARTKCDRARYRDGGDAGSVTPRTTSSATVRLTSSECSVRCTTCR